MKEIAGAPQWVLPGWLHNHWKPAMLALALSPCVAALVVRDPADTGLFPPCPFLTLTGLQCPGCGTLRGLHQLLNGHLIAALGLNIVMVLGPALYRILHSLNAGAERYGPETADGFRSSGLDLAAAGRHHIVLGTAEHSGIPDFMVGRLMPRGFSCH